jgi:protein tyrosine phosphatase (PTP) superfamily phosphohydrolase (DUF442 family)
MLPGMPRLTVCFVVLAATFAGAPEPPGPGAKSESAHIEAPGLHNVYCITRGLYSGSSPEGESGFRSLRELGIRTIISVDGARPDVERARRFGMRYVHVPVGYGGIAREQVLRIAKAVRDLPRPVYIHCHHGMHRGPTAAALVHLCLDEQCTLETALAEMRRAGTDPRYGGLYASARQLRRPSAGELDGVAADFPEVARTPALVEIMVAIDGHWDRLKAARASGWRTPADHPDVSPAHEALQLVEQFREAGRAPDLSGRPDAFWRRLVETAATAAALEESLRGVRRDPSDNRPVEQAFKLVGAACNACHASYRDIHR